MMASEPGLNAQKSSQLNFLDGPIDADSTTDILYMMCPMHLLTIKEKIKEIKVGQILAILTDYEGALEDIPSWCDISGNEFLGVLEDTDHYKFYVRKVRETR
jgi:TusA-related sulfurtransferase